MEDRIIKIEKDLDLNNNFLVNCNCKQYDTIKFIFNMYSDGVKVDLSDCIFRLQAKKGDGLPYVQNDIKYIKVSENTVTIDCDNQLTARAGDTVAEVVITDKDNHMKTSFDVRLSIKPSAIDGLVNSEATITILDTLEEKLNRIDDIGTVLEEANTIEKSLNNLIPTGNILKDNLDSIIGTGSTLKNDLDMVVQSSSTLKSNLDTANVLAEHNLEELNKLGDVTDLAKKVQTNTNNISSLETNKTDILNTIGTETMGTIATTLKGAIAENTTQLNQIVNNKLDKTAYISKSTSLTLLNNWVIETGTAEVCREGKLVSIRANIKGGIIADSTIITVLPEEYRPKETCMLPFISCDTTYNYISGYLMVYMNGQVAIGGSTKNTRVIINATFNL